MHRIPDVVTPKSDAIISIKMSGRNSPAITQGKRIWVWKKPRHSRAGGNLISRSHFIFPSRPSFPRRREPRKWSKPVIPAPAGTSSRGRTSYSPPVRRSRVGRNLAIGASPSFPRRREPRKGKPQTGNRAPNSIAPIPCPPRPPTIPPCHPAQPIPTIRPHTHLRRGRPAVQDRPDSRRSTYPSP